MLWLVRKRYDFCLDARTVTWADALDLPVIQRGVGETFAQDCMTGFVGKRCPTAKLFQNAVRGVHIRELMEVVFSGLFRHFIEVHAACIDTHRCSGLHPFGFDA